MEGSSSAENNVKSISSSSERGRTSFNGDNDHDDNLIKRRKKCTYRLGVVGNSSDFRPRRYMFSCTSFWFSKLKIGQLLDRLTNYVVSVSSDGWAVLRIKSGFCQATSGPANACHQLDVNFVVRSSNNHADDLLLVESRLSLDSVLEILDRITGCAQYVSADAMRIDRESLCAYRRANNEYRFLLEWNVCPINPAAMKRSNLCRRQQEEKTTTTTTATTIYLSDLNPRREFGISLMQMQKETTRVRLVNCPEDMLASVSQALSDCSLTLTLDGHIELKQGNSAIEMESECKFEYDMDVAGAAIVRSVWISEHARQVSSFFNVNKAKILHLLNADVSNVHNMMFVVDIINDC